MPPQRSMLVGMGSPGPQATGQDGQVEVQIPHTCIHPMGGKPSKSHYEHTFWMERTGYETQSSAAAAADTRQIPLARPH